MTYTANKLYHFTSERRSRFVLKYGLVLGWVHDLRTNGLLPGFQWLTDNKLWNEQAWSLPGAGGSVPKDPDYESIGPYLQAVLSQFDPSDAVELSATLLKEPTGIERIEMRFQISIPQEEQHKLFRWSDVSSHYGLGGLSAQVFGQGQEKHWWLFEGRVPTSWICRCDRF